MTAARALAAALAEQPGTVALIEDLQRLIDPAALQRELGAGRRVLVAAGNVGFRLAWEAARPTGLPLVVLRQRPDVFLPDIEHLTATGGHRRRLTPLTLLRLATGRHDWPEWVEAEVELVRERLQAIVRESDRRAGSEWTEATAETVLLAALLGLDLETSPDPAELWLAVCRHERRLRQWHKRRSPLTQRLQAWLRRQPAPVGWLSLDDPGAAIRLTWLVALLQPHLPQLLTDLPQLYPGAQPLTGEDVTAVARVAYRLERLDPALAAAQRDAGEAVLDGPLRAAVVQRLELTSSGAAVRLLQREPRSGQLLLLALRSLLEAIALDDPPRQVGLVDELLHLAAGPERFSHAADVRAHARLLALLLRLGRLREQLAAADGDDRDQLLRLAAESDLGLARQLAAEARETLADHALADVRWSPTAEPARHKAVMAALYHAIRTAETAALTTEQRLAEALLETPGELTGANFWDTWLTPLRRERGQPRTCLVLVAGLSWSAWREDVGPRLQTRCELSAEPLPAALPAAGSLSLIRAVAGQPTTAEIDESLAARRPELALRRPAHPPRALAPLAEAGLVRFVRTSREFCLLGLDLLAGGPVGVPVDEYRRRLDLLTGALIGLLHSGRRDELLAVVGVSGAVACADAPGEALGGEVFGARCLRRPQGEECPAGAIAVPLPDGTEWLLATSSGRLAPAAAGRVMADGGLAADELLGPRALLTPLPAGERSQVAVGALSLPTRVVAGEPAELAVYVTLTGGALAEVATLTADLPEQPTTTVTLDLGERRRLGLTFLLPAEPPGPREIEVTLRVGRRRLRRRATTVVVASAQGTPPDAGELSSADVGDRA